MEKCNNCEKEFKNKKALLAHMVMHKPHKENGQIKLKKERKFKYEQAPKRCEECNEILSYEKAILQKFELAKAISYREFLAIKNQFKVKNQLILPLAYKHDLFMANNVLEKFTVHFMDIGKMYYTHSI